MISARNINNKKKQEKQLSKLNVSNGNSVWRSNSVEVIKNEKGDKQRAQLQ